MPDHVGIVGIPPKSRRHATGRYGVIALWRSASISPAQKYSYRTREIGALERAICERYGLVGVFPADEEDDFDPALSLGQQALAISRAIERVMQGCDAMIINLTPPWTECRCRFGLRDGLHAGARAAHLRLSDDSRLFVEHVRAFSGMRPVTSYRRTPGSGRDGDRAVRVARQPDARGRDR